MKNKTCPICHDEIYSEFGDSCRFCGMVLRDQGREFCSKVCRKLYKEINNEKNI